MSATSRGLRIAVLSALAFASTSLGAARPGHTQNKSQDPSIDFDYASEHSSPFWEAVLKGSNEGDDEIRDQIAHAQVLWDHGERDKALDLLQEVIRTSPTNSDAIFLLGQFQFEARNWPACADALTRSYELSPDYALPSDRAHSHLQSNLATCLLHAGRYEPAIDHLRRLLSRNHDSAELNLRLGQALMASGRLHEAIDALQIGQERRHPGATIAYAVALDRAERLAESKEILHREVSRRPDLSALRATDTFYAPAEDEHYYLGLAYAEQDKDVRALFHMRQYLALAPNSPWASRARAHLDVLGSPTLGAHLVPTGSANWQPEDLRSAIEKQSSALQACVAGQPFVLANISITGLVGPSGTAVEVQARIEGQVETDAQQLERAVECFESAARKIRIPKLSGAQGSHASVEFAVLGDL